MTIEIIKNNRSAKRLNCDYRVNVYSYGVEDVCNLSNISEDGCCLESGQKYYKLGDLLKIQMIDEYDKTPNIIVFQCKIVRIQKGQKTIMGCQLHHGLDYDKLIKLIQRFEAIECIKRAKRQ